MPVLTVNTYQTNSRTKHATRRKGIDNTNGSFKPHHDFSIVSSKVTERMRLLLKDVGDGVGRFTVFELVNDWMLNQVGLCSFLEFVQGSFRAISVLKED